MGQRIVVDSEQAWRNLFAGPVDRLHGRAVRLGLIATVTAMVPASGVAHAQDEQYRLTVRPHEMATGTRNPGVGDYRLSASPQGILTVPSPCVGARRCPLVVVYPGTGLTPRLTTEWYRPMAEKYGMIVLALSSNDGPGEVLDGALQEVLEKFAVDPDKMALIGRCGTGGIAWRYLGTLGVFSRIGVISATPLPFGRPIDPENKTTRFFVDVGLQEGFVVGQHVELVRQLRDEGHPVALVVGMRGHEHQLEDYDFFGHWLQESWATSTPAARAVVADPLPLLTADALTRLTAFWTGFAKESDSIRTTARRAHLREVVVPVAEERPSVWLMDVAALAARYPSVAADLRQAGLTAQQHDDYRLALISAVIVKHAKDQVGAVAATSLLGKNVAFVEAHPDELAALERAGIDDPDRVHQAADADSYPKLTDAAAPLGMWRTP